MEEAYEICDKEEGPGVGWHYELERCAFIGSFEMGPVVSASILNIPYPPIPRRGLTHCGAAEEEKRTHL